MHPALRYVRNIAVWLDQGLNVVFLGGDPDETISSVAAKARNAGRRWGCVLCKLLDRLDPDHCTRYLEADEGKHAVLARPDL